MLLAGRHFLVNQTAALHVHNGAGIISIGSCDDEILQALALMAMGLAVDTGNTLKYMIKQLKAREPKSVRTVVLLHKVY